MIFRSWFDADSTKTVAIIRAVIENIKRISTAYEEIAVIVFAIKLDSCSIPRVTRGTKMNDQCSAVVVTFYSSGLLFLDWTH